MSCPSTAHHRPAGSQFAPAPPSPRGCRRCDHVFTPALLSRDRGRTNEGTDGMGRFLAGRFWSHPTPFFVPEKSQKLRPRCAWKTTRFDPRHKSHPYNQLRLDEKQYSFSERGGYVNPPPLGETRLRSRLSLKAEFSHRLAQLYRDDSRHRIRLSERRQHRRLHAGAIISTGAVCGI